MAARPHTHRAATIARREALLQAALEIVAEQGIGAVTHRAIAARAGLPLSTTSYFFGSLEDLLLEALRHFAEQELARYDAVARTLTENTLSTDEAIDAFVALVAAQPSRRAIGQFEAYLEAARRPELRDQIAAVLDAFAAPVETALAAAGIRDPAGAARALVALADGFALQRLVRGADQGDAVALAAAVRALLAGWGPDHDTAARSRRR